MIGPQPNRKSVGPSEESNREVAVRAGITLAVQATCYVVIEQTPVGAGLEGAALLVFLIATIHGLGWITEGIGRVLLWRDTRGYAHE